MDDNGVDDASGRPILRRRSSRLLRTCMIVGHYQECFYQKRVTTNHMYANIIKNKLIKITNESVGVVNASRYSLVLIKIVG